MSGLPGSWVEAEINDIAEVVGGGTPSARDETNFSEEGGVPWITPADLSNYRGAYISRGRRNLSKQGLASSSAKLLPQNSVLLSSRAPIGYCAIAANPIATNQGFRSLVLHEGMSAEYIRYFLLNSVSYLQSIASGTTFLELSGSKLKSVRVPVAPGPEQKRIVAKIDSLTAKSARARTELAKIEALVERYKLALLRNAFRGQLTMGWRAKNPHMEPVQSLLNRVPPAEQPRGGRQATDTVIKGKAAISVNNPQSPSPDGWAWIPLAMLARQETGHTPSRSHPEWWDGDIPWIGIRDAGAHHGKTIFETQQKTNAAGLANSAARLLPAGTVCLSRTASVGYIVMLGRPMSTSQDFVTWSCTEALQPEYLQYALMAEGDDIRNFGRGTTHTTIYFPEVRAFHIHLAPLEEQKKIIQIIRSSFARIDRFAEAAKQGVVKIDALNTAVLRNAFEGRLVAQNADDEPASILLERLRSASETKRPPRTKRATKSTVLRAHKRTSAMTKSRFDLDVAGQPYLSNLVEASGPSVQAEELYRRSQLTMPDFYKQLAFEVDEGFLVQSPGGLMRRA